MAFPWLKDDKFNETDSVGQKLPRQQQAARISQFNAAASIEDAYKQKFMENYKKEQQYEQDRQRFLQHRNEPIDSQQQEGQPQQQQQQQLPPGVEVDWAGFIVPGGRRQQYDNHVSQRQALKQENGYIVPQSVTVNDTNQMQHATRSKKHFENDQSFQTWDKGAASLPHRSATYQAGPGTKHDTSHWQTSTQALYKGQQVGEGRGFLPHDKVGSRKKFKPAFEQASSQRLSIHQQPLQELGGNTTQHHQHQQGSMASSSMEPREQRVDYAHAGGTGMRSMKGSLLSGGLAASVARVVKKPSSVQTPSMQGYDKLKMANGTLHTGHMPGYSGVQRRPF
jgi:hypothetical protein|tara:strand:- start:81 stop:1091 length:1011 start_codon:yes stop_codon:yes gene_type:complete